MLISTYVHSFRSRNGFLPEVILESQNDHEALEFVLNQLKNPDLFLKKIRNLYADPNAESYDVLEFKDGKIYERYSMPQRISGKSVGRVWSFRDVTDRKKAEQALLRNEAQLLKSKRQSDFLSETSRILSNSLEYQPTLKKLASLAVPFLGDWCLVFDPDLKLVAIGAHESKEGEKIGKIIQQALPSFKDKIQRHLSLSHLMKSTLLTNLSDEILSEITQNSEQLRQLQTLKPQSTVLIPLIARQKPIGLLVLASKSDHHFDQEILDLIEEFARRAVTALDNSYLYEEAQKAIQTREYFMAIASHELRTPLTPLKLQLQLMSRMIRKGESKDQSLLNMIETSDSQVDRFSRLVEDLLEVSRISAGRMNLHRERTNLSALIHGVIERFRTELEQEKCPLMLQIDASIEGYWDRLRIEQTIINLLTNAMKYGAGRPIRITSSIQLNHAIVSVQDFGIGIDPEDQNRIFDRFERAVSIRRFGGLGMGLYIARQSIEAHGGTIRVESKVGYGSTFTIVLPLDQSGPEDPSARS